MQIESFTLTGSGERIRHAGEPLSKTNITQYIAECEQELVAHDTSREDKWFVISPNMLRLIKFGPTLAERESWIRSKAYRLKLRGGARKAYIRSRRNSR
jgi:hypothetical protein